MSDKPSASPAVLTHVSAAGHIDVTSTECSSEAGLFKNSCGKSNRRKAVGQVIPAFGPFGAVTEAHLAVGIGASAGQTEADCAMSSVRSVPTTEASSLDPHR